MKTILSLFGMLSLISGAFSQNLIAVQNGGNPSFYTNLDSAYLNAQPADTIFLPGGIFHLNPPIIDKTIHLVGLGHDPDSTQITYSTKISSGLTLVTGAEGTSLHGLDFGSLVWGTDSSNQIVNDILIAHCSLGHIEVKDYSGKPNTSSNIVIRNNVLLGIFRGGSGQNNAVLNNNMLGAWTCEQGTYFGNNIFRQNKTNQHVGTSPLYLVNDCTFENNIFLSGKYLESGAVNCSFRKNICIAAGLNGTVGADAIYGLTLADIFVNVSGNVAVFDYDHDYQLTATSQGKNFGFDGTDVGIYGGLFPWRVGSIPFNPHVSQKSIDPMTTNTGKLPVNIQVRAQDY